MKKNLYGVPKARTDNIVVSDLNDELLLYCLKTNKAFCLNQTAAAVYQSADGIKSTMEIADVVSKQLKSKVTEDFVLFTLDELKSQNLVEFSVSNEMNPQLTSRREAIRKIGLTTAVALPIVTMLVAPKVAQAQSCGVGGDDCTGGSIALPIPQGTCCPGFFCCQVSGSPIPGRCNNFPACAA